MKNRSILFTAALAVFIYSCKSKTANTDTGTAADIAIITTGGVTSYSSGQPVKIRVRYPSSLKVDSVVYLLDSVRLESKKDSSMITIKTDSIKLGTKLLIARVYWSGKSQDVSTNLYLKSGKEPERLTYKVIRKFPHDTSAYTEGLLYHDGYLYESTGNEGHSEIRKVELETGKVIQRQKLNKKYFGEGSAIVGDKIVMFTYKDKVGFVFDKNTFKPLSQFNNNVGIEGWGVTFDGNKLYLDDSTNRIWFLDKNDYHQIGFIDVFDDRGPVEQVNELEYIDGKLYANIYTYDTIIVIDPKTGAVLQSVNMTDLWPGSERPAKFDGDNNVLNGIAWDAKGKRLFVTGKKWPYVYQVEFVKK